MPPPLSPLQKEHLKKSQRHPDTMEDDLDAWRVKPDVMGTTKTKTRRYAALM